MAKKLFPDKEYKVTWEIDVNAENPIAAASQAEEIMRGTLADKLHFVYTVLEKGPVPRRTVVDLEKEEQ